MFDHRSFFFSVRPLPPYTWLSRNLGSPPFSVQDPARQRSTFSMAAASAWSPLFSLGSPVKVTAAFPEHIRRLPFSFFPAPRRAFSMIGFALSSPFYGQTITSPFFSFMVFLGVVGASLDPSPFFHDHLFPFTRLRSFHGGAELSVRHFKRRRLRFFFSPNPSPARSSFFPELLPAVGKLPHRGLFFIGQEEHMLFSISCFPSLPGLRSTAKCSLCQKPFPELPFSPPLCMCKGDHFKFLLPVFSFLRVLGGLTPFFLRPLFFFFLRMERHVFSFCPTFFRRRFLPGDCPTFCFLEPTTFSSPIPFPQEEKFFPELFVRRLSSANVHFLARVLCLLFSLLPSFFFLSLLGNRRL